MIRYLYLAFPILLSSQVHAQVLGTELKRMYTDHMDSTIVFTPTLPWVTSVKNAFIVSKKGANISTYVYHYDYADIPIYKNIPDSLAEFIRKRKYVRKTADIEAGPFFDVYGLDALKSDSLWKELVALNLWELEDDSTFGNGCPIKEKKYTDKDGNTVTEIKLHNTDSHTYNILLLTGRSEKELSYYDPEEAEKECPGNKNRQRVIALKNLFLKYFEKDSVFWKKSGNH